MEIKGSERKIIYSGRDNSKTLNLKHCNINVCTETRGQEGSQPKNLEYE